MPFVINSLPHLPGSSVRKDPGGAYKLHSFCFEFTSLALAYGPISTALCLHPAFISPCGTLKVWHILPPGPVSNKFFLFQFLLWFF